MNEKALQKERQATPEELVIEQLAIENVNLKLQLADLQIKLSRLENKEGLKRSE